MIVDQWRCGLILADCSRANGMYWLNFLQLWSIQVDELCCNGPRCMFYSSCAFSDVQLLTY